MKSGAKFSPSFRSVKFECAKCLLRRTSFNSAINAQSRALYWCVKAWNHYCASVHQPFRSKWAHWCFRFENSLAARDSTKNKIRSIRSFNFSCHYYSDAVKSLSHSRSKVGGALPPQKNRIENKFCRKKSQLGNHLRVKFHDASKSYVHDNYFCTPSLYLNAFFDVKVAEMKPNSHTTWKK